MFYEKNDSIGHALDKVEEIENEDERTRCLVQLAVSLINRNGNVEYADEIISGIESDKHGYIEYYNKEKQRYLDFIKE